MALKEFTQEQREALCAYRAENHTVQDTIEWFYEEYPDAHEYSHVTIKLWFSSKDGKALYHTALDSIRSEAKSREYANKESRILALVEIVGDIHSALRSMDPRVDQKYAQLFREFREGLAALRIETDGYDSGHAMSAFESMMTEIAAGPFGWAAKRHSAQTPEIKAS